MKIGVISTSRIAQRAHIPALHALDGVEFWSVLSRDADRAKQFAHANGAAAATPAFDDIDVFLADPQLDAVIITSADKLHAEHVTACAMAGKHVFVEKPFVTDLDEGQRTIDVCRQQKVALGVAYHLRWHPGHRELWRRIHEENAIGKIEHVRLLYPWRAADSSNWRAHDDVGRWWSLAGTGTHCLDLLRWFGDQSFLEVSKRSSVIRSGEWTKDRDESALLSYEFNNGMTAQIATSVLFDAPSRFEVFGSDGYAVCEATVGEAGAGRVEISGQAIDFTPQSPFEGEIRDFVAAIEQGRDPEVSGEVALENVREIVLATSP